LKGIDPDKPDSNDLTDNQKKKSEPKIFKSKSKSKKQKDEI